MKTNQIKVQEIVISISKVNEENFISLTDMAKYKNADKPDNVIRNWIKTQKTIEFLSAWEEVFNQDFKPVINEIFNTNYSLTTKKWINLTNAIGINSKSGRYGGTYAHIDIALEFEKWLKTTRYNFPEGIYIIKTNEFYKIGRTNNIKRRIKELESLNPFDVELILYQKKLYSRTVEAFLHAEFRDKNIKGEWFKLSELDLMLIKSKLEQFE